MKYLTPEITSGIILRDPNYAGVIDKKLGFLAAGSIAALDVDLTLTVNGMGTDLTSWGVLTRHYDPVSRDIDDALYNVHEPLVQSDALTLRQAEFWWSSSLQLIVDNEITRKQVKEAGEFMKPRPGMHEFIRTLKEGGIQDAWITAGLADVCKAFARHNNVKPRLLQGTRFTYYNGVVNGWLRDSVVHPLNKNERSLAAITKLRQPDPATGTYRYPGTLLVGDGVKDPRMVSEAPNVLRICVANPHGENDNDFQQTRWNAGYDLILGDESLNIATAIARRVTELRLDPSHRMMVG